MHRIEQEEQIDRLAGPLKLLRHLECHDAPERKPRQTIRPVRLHGPHRREMDTRELLNCFCLHKAAALRPVGNAVKRCVDAPGVGRGHLEVDIAEEDRPAGPGFNERENVAGAGFSLGRVDPCREPGQRGGLEDGLHRQLDAEPLLGLGDHPDGGERVAANGEKVILGCDPGQVKEPSPNSGEIGLGRAEGAAASGRSCLLAVGGALANGLAVNFAARCSGQRIDEEPARGDHLRGKPGCHPGVHRRRRERAACLWHDRRDD